MKDVNRFKMFPDTLVAHADQAMLVTGVHGHVEHGIEGFYRHQTRFLSRLVPLIDGRRPAFVSANPVEPSSFIAYYLAPSPAGRAAGPPGDDDPTGGEVAEKAIELQACRFVGGGMHQDVVLTNHGLVATEVELAWEAEADFADLAEAMQGRRLQAAPVTAAWALDADHGVLTLAYGHPELPHATALRFSAHAGGPTYQGGRVAYRVALPPHTPVRLCLDVVPIFLGEAVEPVHGCGAFGDRTRGSARARERWEAGAMRLETPNAQVQAAWDRAVADLGGLFLGAGRGELAFVPAAGIPLYQALFGRDTLTTGWQAGLLGPAMLRGALRALAARIGTRADPAHDEQPGKLIHQAQRSPLSLLGLNPYRRYYGDYAGPGMFAVGVAWDYAATGDRAFLREMRGPVLEVLAWMDRDGDPDGDGFYEYATAAGAQGTKNQGWKDSPQAVLGPDGAFVPDPLAVVEIQGYYHAAKQLMGLVFLAAGEPGLGLELLGQAQALKRRFNQAFWLPEQGFYALALGPDKRPVATVASNMGHCLACGIVDRDKALLVADRLMAPDMFSGWGVRTLSAAHPAYNPFAYHLGSVWPSENGSIALGFKRYGLDGHLGRLAEGLFAASALFDQDRLPEVIGGHARDRDHPHPGIYPGACAPQAWSASAVVMVVQAIAGLVPLAPWRVLLIDPVLPPWLPALTLHDVPVGPGRVSLRCERRADGTTETEVVRNHGGVRVVRQPPIDDLFAGLGARLADLLGSALPF